MAEHRGAGGAAGPVVARRIFASRERAAVRLGAGENVVHVRFVAARVDHLTFFAERGFLADLVVIAVEIVDIFCNEYTLDVFPRTFAYTITRVNGGFAIGRCVAQICTPGVIAGADGVGKRLAVFVGARQTTEICAFARTDAGDEKSHLRIFFL